MTLAEKMEVAAEEAEGDEDQAAENLKKSLTPAEKQSVWSKHQTHLKHNPKEAKALKKASKNEKGVAAAKWLMQKDGKKYLTTAAKVAASQALKKAEEWQSEKAILKRWSPQANPLEKGRIPLQKEVAKPRAKDTHTCWPLKMVQWKMVIRMRRGKKKKKKMRRQRSKRLWKKSERPGTWSPPPKAIWRRLWKKPSRSWAQRAKVMLSSCSWNWRSSWKPWKKCSLRKGTLAMVWKNCWKKLRLWSSLPKMKWRNFSCLLTGPTVCLAGATAAEAAGSEDLWKKEHCRPFGKRAKATAELCEKDREVFERRQALWEKGQKQQLDFVKRTGKSLKEGRPFEKRAEATAGLCEKDREVFEKSHQRHDL